MIRLRRLLILAGLLPLATFVFGQGPRVALKSGVGGWIMGHTALEGELRIQERMSIGLRLGGIYGQVQTEGPGRGMKPPLFTGFFIKAGPKFYLSPERAFGMGGFAIQGQAVFSYWHDWGYQGFGGPMGWRWEYGMGALAQFSYGLKLWDRVVIEPQAAIGWISTFGSGKAVHAITSGIEGALLPKPVKSSSRLMQGTSFGLPCAGT